MNSAKLREVIQQIAGTYNKDFVSITLCEVTGNSDAESKGTIDCTPISGESTTEIPGVKLKAEANDGFMLVPSVGSTVLVGSSTRNNYYVLMCSDIDKVICTIDSDNYFVYNSSGLVFNGGNLGGIAKTGVLRTKFNNLENVANSLILANQLIQAASSSAPATPVTNASLAGFFGTVTAVLLTLTTQAEIQDNKIKH